MPLAKTNNPSTTAQKILGKVKRLQDYMQPGEEPLLDIPGIWDGGQSEQSTPCDVIVTNQRLMGYYFSRRQVFLEAVDLEAIRTVSLRHKAHEPLFRELLVSDGQHRVYIRAPRRHIESLFATLRKEVDEHAGAGASHMSHTTFEEGMPVETPRPTPIYGREDVRTSFERSPLALILLFVGGLVLEILGFAAWGLTGSLQVSLPLFAVGLLAVLTSILVRRQRGG
jgi:hypothetical protein